MPTPSDGSVDVISVTFDPDGNPLGLGDKTGSMPPSQAKRHTVRTFVAVDDLAAWLDDPGRAWGPYPAAATRIREEFGA